MFSLRLLLALALTLAPLAASAAVGPTPPPGAAASPAAASPAPSPRATPPHGIPKIFFISLSNQDLHANPIVVHPGESIRGRVITSANVVYVEARIDYRNQALQRTGAREFDLDYQIPAFLRYMWWLHHDYTLQIIARSIDGVEEKKYLPIAIQ